MWFIYPFPLHDYIDQGSHHSLWIGFTVTIEFLGAIEEEFADAYSLHVE
jgi:hypothetical protein